MKHKDRKGDDTQQGLLAGTELRISDGCVAPLKPPSLFSSS